MAQRDIATILKLRNETAWPHPALVSACFVGNPQPVFRSSSLLTTFAGIQSDSPNNALRLVWERHRLPSECPDPEKAGGKPDDVPQRDLNQIPRR